MSSTSKKLYLEVIFYDNDFGLVVFEALNKLWRFFGDEYYRKPKRTDIPAIFLMLHKKKVLHPLLARLVDAENITNHVENITRYINFKDLLITECKALTFTSLTDDYLKLKLVFHENKKFVQRDNGERACLNLKTGKVILF